LTTPFSRKSSPHANRKKSPTSQAHSRIAGLVENKSSVMPPESSRSRNRSVRSTRRSARDPKKWEVSPPKIFVEVLTNKWDGHRHAPAKIRVRRGCYRYLVWRDGFLKREFYLGKIKNRTPRAAAAVDQALAGAGELQILRAGVKK
jgi:hypothetical protein